MDGIYCRAVPDTTDVLIVGGGFGSAVAARALERAPGGADVHATLVAPDNFLLFSPILPEAASGTIEPRHAVIPLRELVQHTSVVAGRVEAIDLAGCLATVIDAGGHRREVSFKTLVLSPGSVPAIVPIPGLLEHAVGFKTLADAIWLRNRLLRQLEVADSEPDPAKRRPLLTFTFIGGGYAGVEALAELESLARDALLRYPRLQPSDFRWVLIEAQDTLLPGLDARLARYTERDLRKRGIDVYLSTRMESCEDKRIVVSDPTVPPYVSETIVWTAGQRPSPLVAQLGLDLDERGRIPVDDHLRVVGGPDRVYALGDCAAVPDPDGGTCPATAQHALRQGRLCGFNVAADFSGGPGKPFTYRNRGLAVTLGRGRGTAQVKKFTFTGPLAWMMGRAYHLLMMPGLGRKARVVSDWTISLLFPRDVAQLGQLGTPSPLDS
ncbi:MAG: NAD(P)/FAD-dependent oxidoreductase [Acidimicrobiales bacterium]